MKDAQRDHERIMSVHAREAQREGSAARLAARIGEALGHPVFFLAAALLHVGWIWLNVPALSPLAPWDPYPFPLLAMIASVEAPFLALLILMGQKRDARIAELRQEVNLQTSLMVDRRTAALVGMVDDVRGFLRGPDERRHPEAADLAEPLRPDALLEDLEGEVAEADR